MKRTTHLLRFLSALSVLGAVMAVLSGTSTPALAQPTPSQSTFFVSGRGSFAEGTITWFGQSAQVRAEIHSTVLQAVPCTQLYFASFDQLDNLIKDDRTIGACSPSEVRSFTISVGNVSGGIGKILVGIMVGSDRVWNVPGKDCNNTIRSGCDAGPVLSVDRCTENASSCSSVTA